MAVTISGSTGVPASAMPFLVGQVCTFAMTTVPTGFVKCNGQALSRTTYAALFAAIGTTYGAGDGSTTFNVPDTRGEFIRCLDDSRGVDPARGIGTAQAQDTQPHTHSSIGIGVGSYGPSNIAAGGGILLVQHNGATNGASTFGTTETRPRNVAFLACIFTGV
jgi:microcystin-dependent protein